MSYASIKRIYEIDRVIRLGRMTSVKQAARELEVSTRTVERDLDTLRTMGSDLAYNRSKGIYEYTGNPVTLPAQWLSSRDIAIILVAERSLRVFTSIPFHDDIHPVFNRLLNPVRHDKETINYISELCNSVYFHHPFQPVRNVKEEFSTLLDAIMSRKVVSMIYRKAGAKFHGRRKLEPFVLINNGGEWYLTGKCRLSHSIKTFVVSNISSCRIEKEFFSLPDDFKASDYVESGFGRMQSENEIEDIELIISPPASGWIARSVWHPSQKSKELADGTINFTISCPVTDSLVRWIMQMGECVTVKKPLDLKEAVIEKARILLDNNRC